MSCSIYIRPLKLEDALVSYKWRNNPKIWRFTGNRPDKIITPEIEMEWLSEVLKRENDKRFAICIAENDQYIGNVFFTDINRKEAEIHIFIGEVKFWGRGRAFEALCLIGEYGFESLMLDRIIARINRNNMASVMLAKVVGADQIGEYFDQEKNMILTRWIFTRQMYENHPYVLNKKLRQTSKN
jgi:diamine N-acetyltransferase